MTSLISQHYLFRNFFRFSQYRILYSLLPSDFIHDEFPSSFTVDSSMVLRWTIKRLHPECTRVIHSFGWDEVRLGEDIQNF